MASKRVDLGFAHRGYQYQDLVTAYFLATGLIHGYTSISVDRKSFDNDRFDDLVIHIGLRHIRRQIKFSTNPSRPLEIKDLSTDQKDLRIDALIRCYKSAVNSASDEYRVCATWTSPTDPALLNMLEPVSAESSFEFHPTKLYRLRADVIWPPGKVAVWRALRNATDITRQDFVDFATRFLLELECPIASRDFSNPGPLELLLLELLIDRIGIGRYPNQNRNPVDVAARLVHRASSARSAHEVLESNIIEVYLQLQKDFGRVAQEFPIKRAILVERPFLQEELFNRINEQRIVLIGGPGSGKSWTLTRFVEELKKAGYPVAYHYCYLAPGDVEVERRITTNVLFANLIYELIDSLPSLLREHKPIYAAGQRELEDLLQKASDKNLGQRIVLIVDGIDHISRVRSEHIDITEAETDIVLKLASLNLPKEVCLVIGSQPGQHLDPLVPQSSHLSIPDWSSEEIAALARNLNVFTALNKAGLGDINDEFTTQLFERSEGNPLYATFLCRETLVKLSSGSAFDPLQLLSEVPLLEGELPRYYEYLLRTATFGDVSNILADLFGLIDFGLTEEELKAIYPLISHFIPTTLKHLDPILDQASTQGGVRIYHESFRRFIAERLQRQKSTIANILTPLIDWLKGRDFYNDAKSYRFLLPTLRRAGRHQEIFDLVDAHFLSSSVQAGHPRPAIQSNVAVATYVAAEELNWTALARCAELRRAIYTCFEERLTEIELYGKTFAELFGAPALAERLLFDGRPTFPAKQGLLLCSLCDDAGVVPPWREYMNLARETKKKNDEREPNWEEVAIAEFHGMLRLEGVKALVVRMADWLERVESPSSRYFRGILSKLALLGGTDALIDLHEISRTSDTLESVLLVEIAKALLANGEVGLANEIATEIVQKNASPELALECLSLGANLGEAAKISLNLEGVLKTGAESYHYSVELMSRWVAEVGLAAVIEPTQLEILTEKLKREDGWYWDWLRFVVALSSAEVTAKNDSSKAEQDILDALRDLASDTHPFKGDPRACDLYSVREIIHRSIARALRLLHRKSQWVAVLEFLESLSKGTMSRLPGGTQSGPLIPEALIDLLIPYASDYELNELIVQVIKKQVELAEQIGEFYDVHANQEMYLARAYAAGGQVEVARNLWKSASIYLGAYGYRKDITIYELIESIPALGKSDSQMALEALAAVQPCVNAVIEHTDGKETDHAPIYWHEALCEVDSIAGAEILARSVLKYGGTIDWRLEDSLPKAIDATRSSGSPLIIALLELTVPFGGGIKAVDERLKAVERLMQIDFEMGRRILVLLAAQVQGNSERFLPEAYKRLQDFGDKYGISISEASQDFGPEEIKEGASKPTDIDPFQSFRTTPVFPANATPLDLMVRLRSRNYLSSEVINSSPQFIHALGYRLVELVSKGEEEEAIRLIRYYAREEYFSVSAFPIAEIAEGLEHYGYTRIAAIAFSLAYAYSRGGHGWLFLGDSEQFPWFMHAIRLSRETALKTLATEVAYLLNVREYTVGITRHLIELLASQNETEEAFATWYSAFDVIKHRLPGNETAVGPFYQYVPDDTLKWSIDEAVVSLLIARISHPELKRKNISLTGLALLTSLHPDTVASPIQHLLRLDLPVSSALAILQLLLESEPTPYIVSRTIQSELQGFFNSGVFGFRALARSLLLRLGINPESAYRQYIHLVIPTLSSRREEAILSIDKDGRVSDIASIWPEFPQLVAARFNQLFEIEHNKQRMRSRHRAASDTVRANSPETEMLFWEQELFETAFHEVLSNIDAHAWLTGNWNPDIEEQITQRVSIHLRTQVAYTLSRVARPCASLPTEQQVGRQPIFTIASKDEFDGWYRCGLFERQRLFSDETHPEFRGIKTTLAGTGVVYDLPEADNTRVPFGEGRGLAETWLYEVEAPLLRDGEFMGPLTGLEVVHDLLGSNPMLVLHPRLIRSCGLRPGDWPGRMELVDSNGRSAAALRRWNGRPFGYLVKREIPRLEGCDLVIRPDIFERLLKKCAATPIETTQLLESGSEDDESDIDNR